MGFVDNLRTRFIKSLVGKSLYDLYPELLERQPLVRITSDSTGDEMKILLPTMPEVFSTSVWVHKAIKILADNISPLVLQVYKKNGDHWEVNENHLLAKTILDSPNKEMDSSNLWNEWVTEMMLSGEHGLEVVRGKTGSPILELWPRKAEDFTVKKGELGRRYRRVAGYGIDDKEGEPYSLTPEQFIHFKFYHPYNPWRGLSPISAVRYSVVIDQLAQAWEFLFFKNQARPDYAVITPQGITKKEKDEIEKSLEQRFGTNGAHKPIILEEGVTDIKTFSFPPKDTEWLQQRQMSRDEIGAIFGVPDEIMGYGRDTYENFDTAHKVLWQLTLVPLIRFRDQVLTHFLRNVKALNVGERIQTDLSAIQVLQEDLTGKIDQGVKLFGIGVPVNVINDRLGLGLPAIPGGNTAYLPFGLTPVGSNSSPGGKTIKRIQAAFPEYGSINHQALWKLKQSRLDDVVADMKRIAKKEFQRQQNEIGEKLRNGKIYGKGKFAKLTKDERIPPPSELFDFEEEVNKFIEAFNKSVKNGVSISAANALNDLGLPGMIDIDRPAVQMAIKGILEKIARKTNETTWNDLINLFEEAEREGDGIPKIQERLSQYFGDRKSDYQTERIARTTMTAASNAGELNAWKQSNVVSGSTWISALIPDRTRDAHAEAHGQSVGLGEMFIVGGEQLEYPGDPSGSPGNIINCLCVLNSVIKE